MAQTTVGLSGLVVETIITADDNDGEDYDQIGQNLLEALKSYQRGQYKAAAAGAVDAVNAIAAKYGISCGASL